MPFRSYHHKIYLSLSKQAQSLFKNAALSDIELKISETETFNAHRFLLAARSEVWSPGSLQNANSLDLTKFSQKCNMAMLNWLYTDLVPQLEENHVIELMHMAKEFQLLDLSRRTEDALKPMVTRHNCVKFYQLAEEIESKSLIDYTGEIVSQHWEQLGAKELAAVKAPLLYEMLKRKSNDPLHRAIRAEREDVVFLYLIEFDSQSAEKINEANDAGHFPLDLAIAAENESLAKVLTSHNANINRKDKQGSTLVQRYVNESNKWAVEFLLDAGARLDLVDNKNESVLHYLAKKKKLGELKNTTEKILLTSNVNCQNENGETALHQAIETNNLELISLLLSQNPNMELVDGQQRTVLLKALESKNASELAKIMIAAGSDSTAANSEGDSIVQVLVKAKKFKQAEILIQVGDPDLEHANNAGEAVIHTVLLEENTKLVEILVKKGVNVNSIMPDRELRGQVIGGSALHLALQMQSEKNTKLILEKMQEDGLKIEGDSRSRSALDQCLKNKWTDKAETLLELGADVDQVLSGNPILVNALNSNAEKSALFLLGNGADPNLASSLQETPLELAVKNNLGQAVCTLCINGADKEKQDVNGNVPLWNAINMELFDIAETLVQQGADVDSWSKTANGAVEWTLLHRALEIGNEMGASFLINNRADIELSPKIDKDLLNSYEAEEKETEEEEKPKQSTFGERPKTLEEILKGSERSERKKKEKSPNPFGDDSDDDDDENPFGKDSDDEGSESNPFGSSTRSSKRSFSSTISKVLSWSNIY